MEYRELVISYNNKTIDINDLKRKLNVSRSLTGRERLRVLEMNNNSTTFSIETKNLLNIQEKEENFKFFKEELNDLLDTSFRNLVEAVKICKAWKVMGLVSYKFSMENYKKLGQESRFNTVKRLNEMYRKFLEVQKIVDVKYVYEDIMHIKGIQSNDLYKISFLIKMFNAFDSVNVKREFFCLNKQFLSALKGFRHSKIKRLDEYMLSKNETIRRDYIEKYSPFFSTEDFRDIIDNLCLVEKTIKISFNKVIDIYYELSETAAERWYLKEEYDFINSLEEKYNRLKQFEKNDSNSEENRVNDDLLNINAENEIDNVLNKEEQEEKDLIDAIDELPNHVIVEQSQKEDDLIIDVKRIFNNFNEFTSKVIEKTKERSEEIAKQKAKEKAEKKAKLEAEEKARKEAEERARLKAEERVRKEAEERARIEAEEKARLEAKERARIEAEEKERLEAEERERLEAEEKARQEAEEKAKVESVQTEKIKQLLSEEYDEIDSVKTFTPKIVEKERVIPVIISWMDREEITITRKISNKVLTDFFRKLTAIGEKENRKVSIFLITNTDKTVTLDRIKEIKRKMRTNEFDGIFEGAFGGYASFKIDGDDNVKDISLISDTNKEKIKLLLESPKETYLLRNIINQNVTDYLRYEISNRKNDQINYQYLNSIIKKLLTYPNISKQPLRFLPYVEKNSVGIDVLLESQVRSISQLLDYYKSKYDIESTKMIKINLDKIEDFLYNK